MTDSVAKKDLFVEKIENLMKKIKEIEKEADQKVQEMLTVQKELSIVIDV